MKYFAKYRSKTRPQHAATLRKTAAELVLLAKSLTSIDPSTHNVNATAMGCEGRAAMLYWQTLRSTMAHLIDVGVRQTQGAKLPFQQALNLSYALLYSETWHAVIMAHLDPYFGVIHNAETDAGSLVFDLIEPFRAPFADRVLLARIGRGATIELGNDGRLSPSSRKLVLSAMQTRLARPIHWRSRHMTSRDVIRTQAMDFASHLRDGTSFRPFRMKW